MTQALGCEAADLFAGIAPVAYPLTDALLADCQAARPIPVVHFHGINDTNVPYEGGAFFLGAEESHDAWAGINECTDLVPERILTEGNSYCDAYASCADSVINVLCTVDGGHATYPNPDIDVPAVAWDLLSPYSLPSPTASAVGAVSGLKLSKLGADLGLTWGPDCGVGDTFSIYRGDLSMGYDSLRIEACEVDAVQSAIPAGSAEGEFFLVVPTWNGEEGSYGEASGGPREAALSACAPRAVLDSCALSP
jgi:hypothetical protein